MKIEKILFQVNSTISITCELVSRSRIKVNDGKGSWEVDIRKEFASSQSPDGSSYCIGNPNWEHEKRSKFMVNSRELADWLLASLDIEMTLLMATSPTCPHSGIVRFINRFKSPPKKMRLAA